ncbi:MAG: hypothetical protein KH452_03265 [Clostridiales bacterium]|nr:hypothetical protein [Clostridiales bacterium]
MKKKIAYLISAYTEPKTLGNMVRALNCDSVDFFIHVDKKVKIEPFIRELDMLSNVYFLNNTQRVKVNWGGVLSG